MEGSQFLDAVARSRAHPSLARDLSAKTATAWLIATPLLVKNGSVEMAAFGPTTPSRFCCVFQRLAIEVNASPNTSEHRGYVALRLFSQVRELSGCTAFLLSLML
jgi:hypothetical protein